MEWLGVGIVVLALLGLWLWRKNRASAPEPRVVQAVFTAAASRREPLAFAIEQAMAQAVKDCLSRGVPITESDTIRNAMLEAREKVLRG